MAARLPSEFYRSTDTIAVARELLGKLMVVPDAEGRRISGMIVETEAYLGKNDRAAHSFGGRRTARNEVMYLEGGLVYVFFVYGMYYQFNVVTGPAEHPTAILIRGIEPVEGIEIMRQRRGPMKDKNLTSGPGKLCIAMAIDRDLNAADLTGERVWLEEYASIKPVNIAVGPRVGIDYAGDDTLNPWRFWIANNDFVSQK
ncbi:MAG: DNA-3-methyladenine glycosylase [Acidobacteriota bacterium]